jgi:hypothetical protein
MPASKRLTYDPFRDYYIVLGVAPTVLPAELQSAYRARVKVLHPDRNKHPDATAQFQLLNEAYEALRDPETRDLYDQLRAKERREPYKPRPLDSTWKTTEGRFADQFSVQHQARQVISGLLQGPYRTTLIVLGGVLIANLIFLGLAANFSPPPRIRPIPTLTFTATAASSTTPTTTPTALASE